MSSKEGGIFFGEGHSATMEAETRLEEHLLKVGDKSRVREVLEDLLW